MSLRFILVLAIGLQACGSPELEERASRLETDKTALDAELAELRGSLEGLRDAIHSSVTVPVQDVQPSSDGSTVSVSLSEAGVDLDGELVDLERIGPRLSELGPEVRVVITAGPGTSHDRLLGLIDHIRAHGVRHFAINVSEPLPREESHRHGLGHIAVE
ncbi:MAG: hypothetical protein JJ863_24620 [Deltaproteobacteria bacterium]|nr:hypothetical protein [Deltaproteobacteria bacterium]